MSKALLGLLVTTITASIFLVSKVYAQEEYPLPVICDTKGSIQTLISSYGEEPLFIGNDGQQGVKNLKVLITTNDITKTFSVILISEEQERACVVSTGVGFKNIFKY